MTDIDKINVNGTQFRVFRSLPYRVGAIFQRKILEAYADVDIPLSKVQNLELGDTTTREMSAVDFEKLQEAQEYLLTTAVVSPNITDDILGNYQHELQDCIPDLLEELMAKYGEQKKRISE